MKRFGLDYETLSREHPRLVYCSVSAYGRTGPFAERPGFDPIVQAESGMMSMTGEPGGDPLRHPLAIVDTFTAIHATSAILAALYARHETGRGQLLRSWTLRRGPGARRVVDRRGKTGKMTSMATTTLSSKGQLVIPMALRRALRLKPGDRLRVSVQGGRLVLEPEQAPPARLVKARGRRVLVAPPGAPAMTTEEVKKLLSEFP